MSYTRKSRKYSSYRGKVGTVAPNRILRHFCTKYLIRKSLQIYRPVIDVLLLNSLKCLISYLKMDMNGRACTISFQKLFQDTKTGREVYPCQVNSISQFQTISSLYLLHYYSFDKPRL